MPCGYWLLLTRLWLRNMLIVKLLLKWDLQFPPTLSSTCTGDNYLGDASLIQTTDGKISSCPTWLHQKPGEDWLRTESHLYMSNSQTCIRQLYVKAALCTQMLSSMYEAGHKKRLHTNEKPRMYTFIFLEIVSHRQSAYRNANWRHRSSHQSLQSTHCTLKRQRWGASGGH